MSRQTIEVYFIITYTGHVWTRIGLRFSTNFLASVMKVSAFVPVGNNMTRAQETEALVPATSVTKREKSQECCEKAM
jgi:hypothetical protein